VRIEPRYTGFVPLATCHLQGMANLLEAQGLPDARRRIGLSWGCRWSGEHGILDNSGGWIAAVNAAYGLDVERIEFATWRDAARCEERLHAAGLPFVAQVDAYELPCDYHHREHVHHTVIVLSRSRAHVEILDTANNPVPAWYSRAHYERMRTGPPVERHHLYVSRRPPSRLDDGAARRCLLAAIERHRRCDLARLDAYVDWAAATSSSLDVCRVAAERMYAAASIERLGEDDGRLRRLAAEAAAISERWYLVHTIALNAPASRRSQRQRLLRLLRELSAWESAFAAELSTALGSRDRAPAIGEAGA
jgi:hypothetical protein